MKRNLSIDFTGSLAVILFLLTPAAFAKSTAFETCPKATNILTEADQHEATVSWDSIAGVYFEIALINTNTGSTHYSITNESRLGLTDLESNTLYELHITALCGFDLSDVAIVFFTTLKDCPPVANVQMYPTADSVFVTWDERPELYVIVTLSESGNVLAQEIITDNGIGFPGLTPDTEYEVVITIICEDASETASRYFFTTLSPHVYCSSTGLNPERTYVRAVKLNDLNHLSANDGGYADNTNISTTLTAGTAYQLEIIPGGLPRRTYFAAWIDFNNDGDFTDEGEKVAALSTNHLEAVSASIKIPSTAGAVTTRMRVSVSNHKNIGPCGIIANGETEDYTIVIQSESTLAATDALVYPNPVSAFLSITSGNTNAAITIRNANGEVVYTGFATDRVNVSSWPRGVYYLIIDSNRRVRFVKS